MQKCVFDILPSSRDKTRNFIASNDKKGPKKIRKKFENFLKKS